MNAGTGRLPYPALVFFDSNRLPSEARAILTSERNVVYYSAVSIWELAIKHDLHPGRIPAPPGRIVELCEQTGFLPLPLLATHSSMLESLHRNSDAPPHKDPFDRMLIAQAKAEGMTFMTHDSLLAGYEEPCVLLV